ncbi:hypothetical protein ACFPIF_15475 [Brevundimonas faecalis]|uniref:hypothetical protein n=1 Tax=Brevundimonas faecalis TaxID=947378 RepID=UPI003612B79C
MARLIIPDEPTFATFTATEQAVFPISFALFDKANLRVSVNGLELSQSDFTFAGALLTGGGYQGGSVTLNNAATGDVRIWRDIRPVRATNYAPANNVPVGSVDAALNRLTAQQQELQRDVARSLKVGFGDDVPDMAEVLDASAAAVAAASEAETARDEAVAATANKLDLDASNVEAPAVVRGNLGVASLSSMPNLIDSYGAVVGSVAANVAAIALATATGPCFVPPGVFETDIYSNELVGVFYSDAGQISTLSADGGDFVLHKRAHNFAHMDRPPASFGDYNTTDRFWDGDWSQNFAPKEFRVSGGMTLGQPTVADYYLIRREAIPDFMYYLLDGSGYNDQTASNLGRTAGVASGRIVYNNGQGDLIAFHVSGFVTGAKAGSTNFLANPAVAGYGGDFTAGSDGVYLNSGELYLDGNGYDVAGVGWVINLNRTVAIGAKEAYWCGIRIQSIGLGTFSNTRVDSFFSGAGSARIGLDLVTGSYGSDRAAIALEETDRIYLRASNASSGLSPNSTVFNGTWISGESYGIALVHDGIASLLLSSGQATFGVPLYYSPGASVTPAVNGQVAHQLTSNTSFTIKAKGSDGVVRSVDLTLA